MAVLQQGINTVLMSSQLYPANFTNNNGLTIIANINVAMIPAYDRNTGEPPNLGTAMTI